MQSARRTRRQTKQIKLSKQRRVIDAASLLPVAIVQLDVAAAPRGAERGRAGMCLFIVHNEPNW